MAFVRSMYLENAITFMDLRLLKSIVGKVTEAIWQNPSSTKSLSKMIREFQIAVEDSNVGAKRLYEKIGFVKQTQVVYLKPKE